MKIVRRAVLPLLVAAAAALARSSTAIPADCPFGRNPVGNCLPPPATVPAAPQSVFIQVDPDPDSVQIQRISTTKLGPVVDLSHIGAGKFGVSRANLPAGDYKIIAKKSGYFDSDVAPPPAPADQGKDGGTAGRDAEHAAAATQFQAPHLWVSAQGQASTQIVLARFPKLLVTAYDAVNRKPLEGIFWLSKPLNKSESHHGILGGSFDVSPSEFDCFVHACDLIVNAPGYEHESDFQIQVVKNREYEVAPLLHRTGHLQFTIDMAEQNVQLEVHDGSDAVVAVIRNSVPKSSSSSKEKDKPKFQLRVGRAYSSTVDGTTVDIAVLQGTYRLWAASLPAPETNQTAAPNDLASLTGPNPVAASDPVGVDWGQTKPVAVVILPPGDKAAPIPDPVLSQLGSQCETDEKKCARKPTPAVASNGKQSSGMSGQGAPASSPESSAAPAIAAATNSEACKASTACEQYALALHASGRDKDALDAADKACTEFPGAACEYAGWLRRFGTTAEGKPLNSLLATTPPPPSSTVAKAGPATSTVATPPALATPVAATPVAVATPPTAQSDGVSAALLRTYLDYYEDACKAGACSRLYASESADRASDPSANLHLVDATAASSDQPPWDHGSVHLPDKVHLGIDVLGGYGPDENKPWFLLFRTTLEFPVAHWLWIMWRPIVVGGGQARFKMWNDKAATTESKGYWLLGLPLLSDVGYRFGAPSNGLWGEIDAQVGWFGGPASFFGFSPGAAVGLKVGAFEFQLGGRFQPFPTEFGTIAGSDRKLGVAKSPWIPFVTTAIGFSVPLDF